MKHILNPQVRNSITQLTLQVLNAIKMRVNTARKLDKLMLDDRKETVEKNWLQKAAEEADLVISIFKKEFRQNEIFYFSKQFYFIFDIF